MSWHGILVFNVIFTSIWWRFMQSLILMISSLTRCSRLILGSQFCISARFPLLEEGNILIEKQDILASTSCRFIRIILSGYHIIIQSLPYQIQCFSEEFKHTCNMVNQNKIWCVYWILPTTQNMKWHQNVIQYNCDVTGCSTSIVCVLDILYIYFIC